MLRKAFLFAKNLYVSYRDNHSKYAIIFYSRIGLVPTNKKSSFVNELWALGWIVLIIGEY